MSLVNNYMITKCSPGAKELLMTIKVILIRYIKKRLNGEIRLILLN